MKASSRPAAIDAGHGARHRERAPASGCGGIEDEVRLPSSFGGGAACARRLPRGGTMTTTAGTEFWRDIKPLERVYRKDAAPELVVADAAVEDERFYAPLSETVGTRPLWI